MSGRRAPLIGVILSQPLLNEQGEPYGRVPCNDNPEYWDDDASADQKQWAQAECRQRCKAIAACWRRRLELGHIAAGVWGGTILPSKERVVYVRQADRPPPEPEIYIESDLEHWARIAGVGPYKAESEAS